MERRCHVCKQLKNLEEFGSGPNHPHGRQYECKACAAQRKREYRTGLTPQSFAEKLAMQNGVCAVCGRTNKNGKPLHIDHDHKTNALRGLLCAKCNTALGMVDDDRDWLRALIIYLNDFENAPSAPQRISKLRRGKKTQVSAPCLECGKIKFIAAEDLCWACYARKHRQEKRLKLE